MFKIGLNFGLLAIIAVVLTVSPRETRAAQDSPEIPFLGAWSGSAHANAASESFRHWDKDGKVPKACAKCHSSDGFRDFIGADGSTKGAVDHPAKTDTVITCVTCHHGTEVSLDAVTFPSGVSLANTGRNTRCMTCHQGRQSGANVDAAVNGLPLDTPSPTLKFLNVHYRAAAATVWGSMAKIGYEYAGADYQGRFEHVSKLDECVECHDPHALNVRVETCVRCHGPMTTRESMRAIRISAADFDGDGNSREGMAGELETLQQRVLKAMQLYAKGTVKKPLAYEAHTYPYFFIDTNGNGTADPDEAQYKNQYNAWTPRLLKAGYNYQFALKDPGAYAHNPYYVMQLLHDSLADLSADMTGLVRP